ncbi:MULTISPECIES: UbiA family prenyltransferase [Haloferax]|uniref:Ubiquinone biosynthesis protein UbiA n=2 Tax=Haloferax TaxID=2251 RepID=A0A6G1YYU9_9EURY|nr:MULTISPECIES: UbiA family prenyltransferase [Haloferax]KAB1186608.1 ubiquinone biosynthesis protein UbiA [Haloferax sp. CBA1149]MRW79224.1 ubiquinone biosynthesis protein UbiA [Haloferax marinisediminis]
MQPTPARAPSVNTLQGFPTQVYAAVVHSSLFLGLATIGEVYVASSLAGVGANTALVVGLLATVGVYNLDKLADLETDAVNYAERTAFVSAYPRVYAALSIIAVVGAVALAIQYGGLYGLGLTLFPGAIAAVYSFPIIPSESVKRLKDVFLVNTTVVSLAWAVPVAFVPVAVAVNGSGHLPGAAVAALWFFFRSAVSVEVHNVRDVTGDAENGVETLPTALGVRRTQYVLYTMEVLSLVLVVAAATLGYIPWWAPSALTPALVYSTWITYSLTDTNWSVERLCTLRDGEGVLMTVGVAVVVFGMPFVA